MVSLILNLIKDCNSCVVVIKAKSLLDLSEASGPNFFWHAGLRNPNNIHAINPSTLHY